MKRIPPAELPLRPFQLLDRRWALLVAGEEQPNPMTISWGGFGTVWERPAVTVYVRHSRYTFSLLEKTPEFTVNILPEERRAALDLCGSRSGRELDKWEAAGLRPEPSAEVSVPRVAGAELVFECRVMAAVDVTAGRIEPRRSAEFREAEDPHRAYIGEVRAVWSAGG